MLARSLVLVLLILVLGGCVSSRVQTGAAYGALAGAAAGGTVGFLITDEDLLGSPATPDTGDTSISRGGGLAASLAIGGVGGAVVGAMVGARHDDRYADIEIPTGEPATDIDDEDIEGLGDDEDDEEARVDNPYVSF